MFLSHYRSVSFVFFLMVTCKYGNHNLSLNNTRTHEIYGWSRARAGLGVTRVFGPSEVRTKSPKCLGHIKLPRSSRAPYLRVLWPRGCKIPYVYLTGSMRFTCGHPRGLWIPYGHGNIRMFSFAGTVRSHADTGCAWEYLYDQWRRALRCPVSPASASSGYIYQDEHAYVTFDPFGPGRLLTTGLLWARNRW